MNFKLQPKLGASLVPNFMFLSSWRDPDDYWFLYLGVFQVLILICYVHFLLPWRLSRYIVWATGPQGSGCNLLPGIEYTRLLMHLGVYPDALIFCVGIFKWYSFVINWVYLCYASLVNI